jgi:hypothetical protein
MKKVKNQKKTILTPSSGPQRNLKQLFLVLAQSEKTLREYTAHTLAKIKWYISGPHFKKFNFYFSPQVPYL